jgi:hypothetical protein
VVVNNAGAGHVGTIELETVQDVRAVMEVNFFGVAVCVVEPGAVASSFVANVGIDPEAALAGAGPYAPAMQAYVRRTMGAVTEAQSPADAAAAIVATLTSPGPPAFRVQTSDAARGFVAAKLADVDGSRVLGATSQWVR